MLVVGAAGQLGTAAIRELVRRGMRARALVRPGSAHQHLVSDGIELCVGDLRDAASLRRACAGAHAVIATAGVVFPRGPYKLAVDEGHGYSNLIKASQEAGVAQLVFMSVPIKEPWERRVPTFRYKRIIERRLVESGIPFTIFRGALFMDDYFALMGSTIPLRGAEALQPTASILAFSRTGPCRWVAD